MLSWDKLGYLGASVKLSVLSSPSEIGQLSTVWYATPDGTPGDWRNDQDELQTVAEVAEKPGLWTLGEGEGDRELPDVVLAFG